MRIVLEPAFFHLPIGHECLGKKSIWEMTAILTGITSRLQ